MLGKPLLWRAAMRIVTFTQTPACPIIYDTRQWLADNLPIVERLLAFARALPTAAGLAANQVEIDGVRLRHRFFVMNFGKAWAACLNPRIDGRNGEFYTAEETCLSWPGKAIVTRRWPSVEASFCDINGDEILGLRLDGWLAQVFQHETDHLDGVGMKVA